jgi:hypothetical protein
LSPFDGVDNGITKPEVYLRLSFKNELLLAGSRYGTLPVYNHSTFWIINVRATLWNLLFVQSPHCAMRLTNNSHNTIAVSHGIAFCTLIVVT